MRKLAALRVFKKNFQTQQEVTAERKCLTDSKEILNYTWRLFRDKLNSNSLVLADMSNPRVKFNISKYFQFKFGTELCDVDVNNLEEVEEFVRDLDLKTIYAMEAPHEIKRSPCLITIELVLKEL